METTWDAVWGRLFSSSPELAAAQAKVFAAQWAVRKACADRCPNWDVESGYSHDNATGFDTGGITVSVPLPLFNRNQGAIRQANADLQAAQAEVDRVVLDLRTRLAAIFERYVNAREFVNRYERNILPNAKESVESGIFALPGRGSQLHIAVARAADLFANANRLSRLATGIARNVGIDRRAAAVRQPGGFG